MSKEKSEWVVVGGVLLRKFDGQVIPQSCPYTIGQGADERGAPTLVRRNCGTWCPLFGVEEWEKHDTVVLSCGYQSACRELQKEPVNEIKSAKEGGKADRGATPGKRKAKPTVPAGRGVGKDARDKKANAPRKKK